MKKKININNLKIPSIDNKNTKVLLIGVSNFPEDNGITQIPNVKQNIKDLSITLANQKLVNIPKENIVVSLNDTKLDIERKLAKISTEVKSNETLIVYYSGHGIISTEDFGLYLTTKNSTRKTLDIDSIRISKFQELISRAKAERKIVIIDACHSGQIHNLMTDMSSKINVELNKFEGIYVMTSASADNPSLYPASNPRVPTYFTGCLIDVIKEGIDNKRPFCNIREIFEETVCKLQQIGIKSNPQQSIYKNADEIVFCYNKKYKIETEEDLLWEKALIQHKKELYEQFLITFPDSKYKLRANNMLKLFDNKNDGRIKTNTSKYLNLKKNKNNSLNLKYLLLKRFFTVLLHLIIDISDKLLEDNKTNNSIINNFETLKFKIN